MVEGFYICCFFLSSGAAKVFNSIFNLALLLMKHQYAILLRLFVDEW